MNESNYRQNLMSMNREEAVRIPLFTSPTNIHLTPSSTPRSAVTENPHIHYIYIYIYIFKYLAANSTSSG